MPAAAVRHPRLSSQIVEKDSRERAWCVYERMVADMPLQPQAWLAFVHFAVRRGLGRGWERGDGTRPLLTFVVPRAGPLAPQSQA